MPIMSLSCALGEQPRSTQMDATKGKRKRFIPITERESACVRINGGSSPRQGIKRAIHRDDAGAKNLKQSRPAVCYIYSFEKPAFWWILTGKPELEIPKPKTLKL